MSPAALVVCSPPPPPPAAGAAGAAGAVGVGAFDPRDLAAGLRGRTRSPPRSLCRL